MVIMEGMKYTSNLYYNINNLQLWYNIICNALL